MSLNLIHQHTNFYAIDGQEYTTVIKKEKK